jgi:hypothetical protein
LAADLVRRQVAVIAAGGAPSALAAKAATTTIPIVFTLGVDPVECELVASLNRPGGNLTGVASLNVELTAKRLELLHEVVPTATDIALLVNPTNPGTETALRDTQAAARILGLQLHILNANTERDFDTVFATLVQRRAGALVISNSIPFLSKEEQLGALAARHAVPTIFQYREFVAAGGLMSYGGKGGDSYVRPAPTPAAFSRARSRPICRSNKSRKSSWSSTSRLRRRSVSPSRSYCSTAPTRLLNNRTVAAVHESGAGTNRRFAAAQRDAGNARRSGHSARCRAEGWLLCPNGLHVNVFGHRERIITSMPS